MIKTILKKIGRIIFVLSCIFIGQIVIISIAKLGRKNYSLYDLGLLIFGGMPIGATLFVALEEIYKNLTNKKDSKKL